MDKCGQQQLCSLTPKNLDVVVVETAGTDSSLKNLDCKWSLGLL